MTAPAPTPGPRSQDELSGGEGFAAAGRRSWRERLLAADGIVAVVAAVLLPLGLMVVLLGWYGAAHTPYLFEQIPYLISGGLAGLGLMLAGAMLYLGSWIARSAASQQASSEELAGLLADIRASLAALPEAQLSAPAVAPRRAPGGNGRNELVATATGSMLHRPDCSVVVGRTGVKPVSASSGLQPCGLCDPLSSGSSLST